MDDLTTSEVMEPSRTRAWLIRAGLAKAADSEIPWLLADLEGGEHRAVRRRWSTPVAVGALGYMVAILILVAIMRSPADLPSTALIPLVGPLVGVAISTLWSPAWSFRGRRRLVLRRHGLHEDGSRIISPSWPARLSPRSWALVQGVTAAILTAVVTTLAVVWLRPWDATVTTCAIRGNQLQASGVVTHRGRSDDAPDVEWIDPATGSVIVASRLVPATTGEFFAVVDLATTAAEPGLSTVTCRIAH